MTNRTELKGYIRFRLDQLGVANGAHTFEALCFELARQRHVSNLLPATGPVQAGGDQGRDFESYRTYLAGSALARSTFSTLAAADLVVGACTLQRQNLSGKVADDLATIFGNGERPNRVFYYCASDLPVARRHALQGQCRTQYDATLEIFDGTAIADMLADPDTFWLAQKFLDVPAELFPRSVVDEDYEPLRQRWLLERAQPFNAADFVDIKRGLRTAMAEDHARPDLPAWIDIMRALASAPHHTRQRQRARYEVAVAELRGRGNLDSALDLVKAFFEVVATAPQLPTDLLDAAVLLVYCWSARGYGLSQIDLDTLKNWAKCLEDLIRGDLEDAERRGDRCTLLEALAMLSGFPASGVASADSIPTMLLRWQDVVAAAKDVPFYPISHIADLVDELASITGKQPAFRALRDQIDELTRQRSGAASVAERSLERGVAYANAGEYLQAIDELQRAKAGWFSGDTMASAVQVMGMLAICYGALNLHIAARYYAAGAAYIAVHTDADDVRSLLPRAIFQLATTYLQAGEGMSYLMMQQQALSVHLAIASDPLDAEKHPDLQQLVHNAGAFRALARRLAPSLDGQMDAVIAEWPLDLTNELDAALPIWSSMTPDEAAEVALRDLDRSPFSDLGAVREVRWSALGIDWTVRHAADRPTAIAALEFAATLQILQVELAEAELLVIPGAVVFSVSVDDVNEPVIAETHEAKALGWQVVMPARLENRTDSNQSFLKLLAVAATALGQTTALSGTAFGSILGEAFARGLPLRAFSVRPARELMDFAAAQLPRLEELALLPKVEFPRPFAGRTSKELAWPETLGPGYSAEGAQERLANRYRRPFETADLSLKRLLSTEHVRSLVRWMRNDGMLDWQILGILWGIVCQEQVEAEADRSLSPTELTQRFMARSTRRERPEDPPVDPRRITPERIESQKVGALASAFPTWGLTLNRSGVDPDGIKRLLDVRYRHSSDDIPHTDILTVQDVP